MKKLIHCAVAAAALVAGGAALAQSAECNAGSQWGVNPGCGSSNHTTQVDPWGGWASTSTPQPQYQSPYPYGYGLPQVIANGGLRPYQAVPQYRGNSRDRDGDGYRNNRDRYPDNPRRH